MAKANEQGHLFEKLTASKLKIFIQQEKGLDIPENLIDIKQIKETGVHEIPIKLGDKTTHFTLEVSPLD